MNFLKRLHSRGPNKLTAHQQPLDNASSSSTTTTNTNPTTSTTTGTNDNATPSNVIEAIDADGRSIRIAPGFNPHLLLSRTNEELCFEEVRARHKARLQKLHDAQLLSQREPVPPFELAIESRRVLQLLLAELNKWKLHSTASDVGVDTLAALELQALTNTHCTPSCYAVPLAWLDAVRKHVVAPQSSPLPPPMPLYELDTNVTASDAVWVDADVWQALCTAYGFVGAVQRGAEPSLAVRIVLGDQASGGDERAIALLAPYRATTLTLFVRACAGLCVAPRGRRLLTHDERPLRGKTCGELFRAANIDVNNVAAISDVRHPMLTLRLAPLHSAALATAADDAALQRTLPASAEQGWAQLAECAGALTAAGGAANAALAALLEWRDSLATAQQQLALGRAVVA